MLQSMDILSSQISLVERRPDVHIALLPAEFSHSILCYQGGSLETLVVVLALALIVAI